MDDLDITLTCQVVHIMTKHGVTSYQTTRRFREVTTSFLLFSHIVPADCTPPPGQIFREVDIMYENEIKALEAIRDELTAKFDAINLAIQTLEGVSYNYDAPQTETKKKRNSRKVAEVPYFDDIPDMNRNGGGIRLS
jgi:hypothetical protein